MGSFRWGAWALSLWHQDSRLPRLGGCGTWAVAYGIFSDKGSYLCSLHWWVDSQPLIQQESPSFYFMWRFFFWSEASYLAHLSCPLPQPFPLHIFDPVGSQRCGSNSSTPSDCSYLLTFPGASTCSASRASGAFQHILQCAGKALPSL